MIEGGDTAAALNPMLDDKLLHLFDALLVRVPLSLARILRSLHFNINELLLASNSNNIFQKCHTFPFAEIVPKHILQREVEDVLDLLHTLEMMIQFAIISSVQYYWDVILG